MVGKTHEGSDIVGVGRPAVQSLRVSKVEKHCCLQATEWPQVLSLRPESKWRG